MASNINGNNRLSGNQVYGNGGVGENEGQSPAVEGIQKTLAVLHDVFNKTVDGTRNQLQKLQQLQAFSFLHANLTKKTIDKTILFSSLVESFVQNEKWLKSEGIFRVSGARPKVVEESSHLNAITTGHQIQFETDDPNVAAGALKDLLRKMQFLKDSESKKSDTLSPQETALLDLVHFHEEEKQQQLNKWFNGLSIDQQKTILTLQKLVLRVVHEKDTTKMTVSNLARVLAPNIVILPESLGIEMCKLTVIANEAVQFLLENLTSKETFLHSFNTIGDEVFRHYFENVEGKSQDLLKIPSDEERLEANELLIQLTKREIQLSDLSDQQIKQMINTLMEEYIRYHEEGFDQSDEILLRKPLQTWELILERGEKPCPLEQMTEEFTILNEMASLVMKGYCDTTPKGERRFQDRLSEKSLAQTKQLVEQIHTFKRRPSGLTSEEEEKLIRWIGDNFYNVVCNEELRNSLKISLLGPTFGETDRMFRKNRNFRNL